MCDHNNLAITMGDVYTSFLVDIHQFHGIDVTREINSVRSMLSKGGTRALLSYLQKHHEVLLHYLKYDAIVPTNVKHDSDGFPVFLNALWRGLLGGDTLLCVTDLRQATSLIRKWAEEEVSADDAVDSFKNRMTAKTATCIDVVDRISKHLPSIIGNDDFETCASWPAVTSGARAEKTPVLQRIDTLQWVPCPEIFRKDGFTICGWGAPRSNRLVPVPKDWSKPRLVFAEPSPSMNLQQLLRLFLESKVERYTNRISFRDQNMQRQSLRRAHRASIDLSDASDHLSSTVIWRFLRKYPKLRSALFWARSQRTQIGGDAILLRCFGTMGNATTFPVMSIFLACLAREAEDITRSYTGYHGVPSTVFGDDIVCDDVIAGTVLELLRSVGLVPNQRKTFIACRFRESCGLDLFDEVDITPMYVKYVRSTCAADVCRLVKYSNAAYYRGYWHLADRLASLTARPLSVNVDEHSLQSLSQERSYAGCVWNASYQKYESRYAPRSKKCTASRDSTLDLAYVLFHGHRIRGSQEPDR